MLIAREITSSVDFDCKKLKEFISALDRNEQSSENPKLYMGQKKVSDYAVSMFYDFKKRKFSTVLQKGDSSLSLSVAEGEQNDRVSFNVIHPPTEIEELTLKEYRTKIMEAAYVIDEYQDLVQLKINFDRNEKESRLNKIASSSVRFISNSESTSNADEYSEIELSRGVNAPLKAGIRQISVNINEILRDAIENIGLLSASATECERRIKKEMPDGSYSSIKVFTIDYKFADKNGNLPTRVLEISVSNFDGYNYFFSKFQSMFSDATAERSRISEGLLQQYESNLERLILEILRSQDLQDQRALWAAFDKRRSLTLYISMDMSCIEFSFAPYEEEKSCSLL